MLPIRTGNPGGDMAAIMARVRKMSDAQLADILAGKDVSVPQFAAMTEAMGRKRLRTAMQGQQAQQQAQQPSVKDQLLAEEAGLAALPAPNMDSIDMAAGGIVAFDEGGEVPRYQNRGLVLDPSLYTFGNVATGYTPDPELERQRKIIEEEERIRAERKEGTKEFFKNLLKPNTVRMAEARGYNIPGMSRAEAAAPAAAVPSLISTADQPGDFPVRAGEDVKKNVKKDGIAALADTKADTKETPTPVAKRDFLSPFAGGGDRMREGIAALKDAKQSDFLLGASKALLGNATLAKAGSEFAGTAMELGAKARKDIRDIEKAASEYDFNVAKAREAAAQGNDDLAYKYAALAEQAKYRTGILGLQGQKLNIMKDQYDMFRVPQLLSKIQADAAKQVKDQYGGIVPPSKKAQYEQDVMRIYREKAKAAGLNPDLYSPGTPSLNVLQSLPKGAKELELD